MIGKEEGDGIRVFLAGISVNDACMVFTRKYNISDDALG